MAWKGNSHITSIAIPKGLYDQLRQKHLVVNRICIQALNNAVWRPEISLEEMQVKIEKLAKLLKDTTDELWELKMEIKDLGLIKKFEIKGKRL